MEGEGKEKDATNKVSSESHRRKPPLQMKSEENPHFTRVRALVKSLVTGNQVAPSVMSNASYLTSKTEIQKGQKVGGFLELASCHKWFLCYLTQKYGTRKDSEN